MNCKIIWATIVFAGCREQTQGKMVLDNTIPVVADHHRSAGGR